MFRRSNIETEDVPCEITFMWDGQAMTAQDGDTVVAALLAGGVRTTREHPVTDEPRAPFCMMGTCFECLVEIDGIPNRQACQVKLTKGMQVCLQRGARK